MSSRSSKRSLDATAPPKKASKKRSTKKPLQASSINALPEAEVEPTIRPPPTKVADEEETATLAPPDAEASVNEAAPETETSENVSAIARCMDGKRSHVEALRAELEQETKALSLLERKLHSALASSNGNRGKGGWENLGTLLRRKPLQFASELSAFCGASALASLSCAGLEMRCAKPCDLCLQSRCY